MGAPTQYEITCTNPAGSTTVTLTFGCNDAPLEVGCSDAPLEDESVTLHFAEHLEQVKDITEMLEEPPRHLRLTDWLMWMVHRAWLNDPTLTCFDFSSVKMPLPHNEPRIAPKLTEALAKNTYITSALLPDSNMTHQQGM